MPVHEKNTAVLNDMKDNADFDTMYDLHSNSPIGEKVSPEVFRTAVNDSDVVKSGSLYM
jgi:hypothetical protein